MLKYFVVRKYLDDSWYDVRTKDNWDSMIHEEDTSVDEGVYACCAWSATQQGAEPGPVWPIAHAFSLDTAIAELERSKKLEPNFKYHVVEVRVMVLDE